MKSIIHTALDCCLVALCAAWLVYGIDGAGNLYRAWAWFISSISLIMILTAPIVKELKISKRPEWRKNIVALLSCTQLGLLFWHGQMLIGGLMTFSCCAFYVVSVCAKESDA